jgi:hypothetical protein
LSSGRLLASAHLVDGVVDELDGVELVEGDLGLGEVVIDPLDEGRTHVDADLLDAGGITVVGFEVVGELGNGVGILAIGDEEDTASIDIDEERDVVVPTPRGSFVDGDAADVAVVGPLARLLHPVMQDAPELGVVLLDEAGSGSDGHGRHQRHGKRLEQQREAGAGPGPRHRNLLDAAVRAGDARGARVQERLMLEEVEMPPGLLHGVVRRAVGLGAVGARKAATCREVDLDVEAALLGVEGGGLDQPRRHDAERQLQQIGITHGLSPAAR